MKFKYKKIFIHIRSLWFWVGMLFGALVALFVSEYCLSFWLRTTLVKAGIILIVFPIICVGCGFIFLSIKTMMLYWNRDLKKQLPILVSFCLLISALIEEQLPLPKGSIGNEWRLVVRSTTSNSGKPQNGDVLINYINAFDKNPPTLSAGDCKGVWENKDSSFFSSKGTPFNLECYFITDNLSGVEININTGPQYGAVDIFLKNGIFLEHIQKNNFEPIKHGQSLIHLGKKIKPLVVLFHGINIVVIMGLFFILSLFAFFNPKIVVENIKSQPSFFNWIVGKFSAKLKAFSIRMNNLLANLKKVPLWVYLVILALLLFFTYGTLVTADSLEYMNWAQSLERGLGYLDSSWQPVTYRGPVFAGLIAISFRFFGASVRSALWMVRLFHTINLLVVYLIGTRFFNRWMGIVASILVATSVIINNLFGYILSDPVVSVFMLLTVLVLFDAFTKRKDYLFILSGLLLGIAYLTKSTAGLLLPLPLLVWLWCPLYRTRRILRGIVCFYAAALLLFLPWLIYTRIISGLYLDVTTGIAVLADPLSSGGASPSNVAVFKLPFFAVIINQARGLADLLVTFYQDDVKPFFILAPLFIFSFVYGFYRLLRFKTLQDGLIIFSFLLYGLLIPIQVKRNIGLRVNIFYFLLFYLLMVKLFWEGIKNINRHVFKLIAYTFICLVFVLQLFVGRYAFTSLFLDPTQGSRPTLNPANFTYGRILSPELEKYQQWLQKNTSVQDEILSDVVGAGITYFYLNARQPIHHIDYSNSRLSSVTSPRCGLLLAIWVNLNLVDDESGNDFIGVVCENQLLAQIREERIRYIILSHASNFLYPYLKTHPAFSESEGFGEFIKIFRINDDPQPIFSYPNTYYEPQIGLNTAKYLKNLSEQKPTKYQQLVNGYLRNWLELSDEVIQHIEQNKYPAFNILYFYE